MADLLKPLDIILRAIREDLQFRKDFSAVADAIVDKIYSFYTNPNCTCKGAIVNWINANVDATNTVIQKNMASITAIQEDLVKAATIAKAMATNAPMGATPPVSGHMPRPNTPGVSGRSNPIFSNPNFKGGKVMVIEKTDAAYSALIQQSMKEQWMYRGVAVSPDTVDNALVWKVFFF